MMTTRVDLWMAAAAMAAMAAVLFGAGYALSRRLPVRALRWAGLGLAAAILSAFSLYSLAAPLVRRAPPCLDLRKDRLCLQTRDASCAAAAAATLLLHHGISATEEEMSGLCLTGPNGTPFHGLWRGLAIKTAGSPLRPRVCPRRADDVLAPACLPALLYVELTRGVAVREPRYARDWGWTVGRAHAVVVLAFHPPDAVELIDPSVGRERWPRAALRDLYTGQGVAIPEP